MRQVLISDITKRLQSLSKINSASNGVFAEKAPININTKRVYDLKRYIENAGISNTEVLVSSILELFDTLIENGTTSDIRKMGDYIAENIIHKSRDAKHTESLIRRRLTRLQHKTAVPSMFPDAQKTKYKAVQTAYENMLEKAIIYRNCDRMLENYNNISKRFNLEAVINENTKVNGVYDTVVELCNRIDTYNMPINVKFNSVIETALYGFESNSIEYKKSDILDAACNYFAFKENGLKSCKEILDATLFYDKNDDTKNIDILTEDEPEESSEPSSVDDMIRSRLVKGSEDLPIMKVDESTEFADIFNQFKKEELAKDNKPENKLRALIAKLYSRNVDSIVEETPDLLKWLRSFFIIGSCAIPIIGPVIMAVGYIADRFISLHMDIEETKKMITCFNNEIKAAKAKLDSSSDNEEKEKLKKYIKSLEDAQNKIYQYQSDLVDDLEIADQYDSDGSSLNDYNDEDFDDFDIDFEEDIDFSLLELSTSLEDVSKIHESLHISEDYMYSLSPKVDNSIIKDLAEAISYFPTIFFKESFKEGMENEISVIKKDNTIKSFDRYNRIMTLESAIRALDKHDAIQLEKVSTIYTANKNISFICEIYNVVSIIDNLSKNGSKNYVLEASFSNSLKLASMKLRNMFNKMNDKEKNISKSIDVNLNNLSKSVERSLTNDNREAVIKGSILPSASKILKMGIMNAGLVVLGHPVAAVIATLGYLGCSAKYKSKERQMLIDEIEIEIKMCDKYIEIAEQKNDMKALKQLLMTKRDLERQLQRIKYKMRVELGQKYYDPKNVGDA